MTEQRLPLYLTSDLFSEYKLCKLLATSAKPFLHKHLKDSQLRQRKASAPVLGGVHSQRTISESHGRGTPKVEQESMAGSRNTSGRMVGFVLPQMLAQGVRKCTLEKRGTHKPERKEASDTRSPRLTRSSQVSSATSKNSSDGVDGLGPLFRRTQSVSLSVRPSTSSSSHCNSTEVTMLFSKSGMGLFRKFLRNKPGERNWLFWLDVEQAKHLDSPNERQK